MQSRLIFLALQPPSPPFSPAYLNVNLSLKPSAKYLRQFLTTHPQHLYNSALHEPTEQQSEAQFSPRLCRRTVPILAAEATITFLQPIVRLEVDALKF